MSVSLYMLGGEISPDDMVLQLWPGMSQATDSALSSSQLPTGNSHDALSDSLLLTHMNTFSFLLSLSSTVSLLIGVV